MRRMRYAARVMLLALALAGASQAAEITQGFQFKFDTPKANGKLTINFFDANGGFDDIKVVVNVTKGMAVDKKRDAILAAFKAEAAKDKATAAWKIAPPANDMDSFTVTNVPKFRGKTLVNVNPSVIDNSKEPVNHVDRLSAAPNMRGIITFASARFDPNGDGGPAFFHAGVDYNGTEFFSEISASVLGSDTSGRHVAEVLFHDLAPKVSSFATIADPAITGTESLVVDLLPGADPNADFGVSFGATSATGYVVGQLVGVPEPGTVALATLAGACGVAGWWRRKRASPR